MKSHLFICILLIFSLITLQSMKSFDCKIATVKYNGGGDWYSNPTALKNLISFANKNIHTNINPVADEVEIGSKNIFNYPYLYLTGHGNIVLSLSEKQNLSNYLKSGGFLHVDDNYGLDKFIRPILNNLITDIELNELSDDHPIYSTEYKFEFGMPKIHEHDGKKTQAFGLTYKGRLVLLYTYETDLGNGWEDPEVHNNSPEKRLQALQMGANIIKYVFTE